MLFSDFFAHFSQDPLVLARLAFRKAQVDLMLAHDSVAKAEAARVYHEMRIDSLSKTIVQLTPPAPKADTSTFNTAFSIDNPPKFATPDKVVAAARRELATQAA